MTLQVMREAPRQSFNKFFAQLLAFSLILAAPGLAPYRAWAQLQMRGAAAGSAPAPVPYRPPSLSGTDLPALDVSSLDQPPATAPDFRAAARPTAANEAAIPVRAGAETSEERREDKGVLPTLEKKQAEASDALAQPGLSAEGASDAARRVMENGRTGGAPLVDADRQDVPPPASAGLAQAAEEYLPIERLKGRTLLLVGFNTLLPYQLKHPLELARRYGFDVMLIDQPKQREKALALGLKPENFIAADIGSHDEADLARIVEQVEGAHKKRPIHAVKTFINIHALLAAHLNEALDLPGNRAAAVLNAHEKDRAREIWNKDPALYLPARTVRSENEARAMFDEMTAAGYTHAVMKPASGGGGFLVKTDIGSREDAAASAKELGGVLDKLVQEDLARAKAKHMDKRPPVLMEAQVPDIVPGRVPNIMLDVEMLLQRGRVVYSNISYNPPSYQKIQETGSTYYRNLFESHPEIAAEIRRVAYKAAMALNLEGNAHLEASLTWHDGKFAVKMIEANARMGGKDMFENVLESDGVDLIEQSILIAFGARADPKPKGTPELIQMRFIIPRWTGKFISIEGEEHLKEAGVWGEWERLPGDQVEALDRNPSAYLGYFMKKASGKDEGPALRDLLAALNKVKITIETPDGQRRVQTAAFGHEENHESFLIPTLLREIETLQRSSAENPSNTGILARLKTGIKQLPGSYYLYALASGLLAMADEGVSVIFTVYGITQFGLVPGLLTQATYILSKALGSYLAAKWNHKFDSKKIFVVTPRIKATILLSVLGLAWALGGTSSWFLAAFFLIQVMRGIIYGASSAMAETEILPRLVGQRNGHLKTANFLLKASIEFSAMVAAFLSARITSYFGPDNPAGPNTAIAIFAALMLVSPSLFKRLKYKAVDPAAASHAQGGVLDKLASRLLYIPIVVVNALHYSIYGLLAGTFAKFVFLDKAMSGNTLGYYDAGALAIGLIGGVCALLAASTKDDDGFLEKILPMKAWFGLAVLAGIAYLWASLAALSTLSFIAAGLLGALVILNKSLWMAYYQSRLKQEHHARMISQVNVASIGATMVPFVLIGIGRYLEMSLMPLFFLINTTATIALLVSWLMTRSPERDK